MEVYNVNKKFKLTDKVTKESIRSPEFKRWLKVVLAAVCIFSLIFQFSTCVFTGLNVYAAEDDSIIGTWVFNHSIVFPSTNEDYYIDFTSYLNSGGGSPYYSFSAFSLRVGYMSFYITEGVTNPFNLISYYNGEASNYWNYVVNITGGADINNIDFVTWLRSNATKQVENVHDFTNEIRQFNDQLTLYVTDSAVWSESFSFEFDVMGFGYSDTLYLQRGGANEYSMSYNFDIDGVFSPWQVYRYGFSTHSGGFLYQNARIIRFITNPDDIEFQQWLLDNTTLVATVDDAPAFDQFYETGYDVGYNAGYEQGFANSLIGDSLSGPINALSSITLIQIGDVEITLGGVVMTAIALCLVLAFLKLYAGG